MPHEFNTGYRPGEVLNDKAQNTRVVYLGTRSETFSENSKARGNRRNQHYVEDPGESLHNVVYLPDEGEMGIPGKTYALPDSRLERVKVEESGDMVENPYDELQAMTVASTLISLEITDVTREELEEIAGEEIADMTWELLETVCEYAREEV